MTRDIPDSVYITLNTPSYEVSYYISLDDDEWTKVIVEQTWEKDMLCSEQEVNVSCEMPHNDKHNPDLSILAHISGKNMDVPCEQCQAWEYNAGGWFSQCRLNAVYPEITTCTSCAYGGRKCSFKNGKWLGLYQKNTRIGWRLPR